MPSPGRVRDAATPALLIFWNLPQAEARGRMGGEERKGEGSSGHALGTRGATRRARSRRYSHCPASQGNESGHRRQRVQGKPNSAYAPPLASRQDSPHLGGLPPQTLR